MGIAAFCELCHSPDMADGITYIDVFVEGTEGYHTFRIPAIVTTSKGTVLAFCEGRVGRHDHSENDILLKRSGDGGRSWASVQVIASDGRNSLNNPQVVALRDSGRLILMYQRYPYGYHSRDIAQWYRPEGLKSASPGYDGERVCRSYLCTSDDDGRSWSEPREVTREVKYADAASLASGPGVGIELRHGPHAGRLLMPFNQRRAGRSASDVYAAYSDDGGGSWRRGALAPGSSSGSANEVQLVELADGSVLLNARSWEGIKQRKAAVSNDGGRSWSPLQDVPALVEPECMGSIIRIGDARDASRTLLFSNPVSSSDRINGSVRISRDDGATWGAPITICAGRFAYSCLTVLPDDRVGCLYETGRTDTYERIVLARFPLAWIDGS